MRKSFLLRSLVLFMILVVAGCGGSATAVPIGAPTAAVAATEIPASDVPDATEDVNALATSVALVQNPPTVPPSGKITPGPQVNFTRKFRFGSLNGTILGWQVVPGDGVTCPTVSAENLALHLQLENTAAAAYSISGDYIKILRANDVPPDTIYQGAVGTGKAGAETNVTVPAKQTLDTVFCTGISAKDDPGKLNLVLGQSENIEARIPLAQAGPPDLGGYAEGDLDQKFTFKGADFTLAKMILTTGVWSDQGDGGQAKTGMVWLLLPTEVNNPSNPNLFIEQTDVTLEVNGETLQPELAFNKMYQAAPYGLEKGKTAEGAILFQVPQGTTQATLHLKSTDGTYTDDVSVPMTLPVSQ